MRYTVTLERPAQRALDALSGNLYRRMVEALQTLATNPRPHGVKKLQGEAVDVGVKVLNSDR